MLQKERGRAEPAKEGPLANKKKEEREGTKEGETWGTQ